ncbi:ABC-2 type transport system ATP-binding protein [Singulisphaera sp. GP187]|uniref:ABC transporter ATP-binding protein n=1 Tax=Singulisphaera sp. GP187 TaxID=1882752 RepID=UPI00092B3AB5|nr:ABC transporter ATP-binding protein [Singulisphaera sp. GP187]SIN99298.1 ABC-2 type transport system ATP-binding protein [Singulisphaera sp. GP187]
MNEDNAIRIEGLTVRYRGRPAVDGLSFDVPTGSVFGLLGENGAGKSTTIKTLLGLVAPNAGRVEVLGLDPNLKGEEVRRKVGYVPETPTLYDWMTPAEIGWFASGFRPDAPGGPEGTQGRYADLIQGFDLPTGRKIKALSKGMRAKVGLALALAPDPCLLILDEPTSGLDLLVRREFLESMVDLAGSGRTVLLSSHQVAEVERVASHVALVHKGKLILAEPLDELKARTFRVSLTLDGPTRPASLPVGPDWQLIDADDAPRQSCWLVHAADRESFTALRALPGVTGLELETPGLEEIYIAYMRRRVPTGVTPSLAAALA